MIPFSLKDDADFETADENEDEDHPRISHEEPCMDTTAIVEPVKDDEDELPWQAGETPNFISCNRGLFLFFKQGFAQKICASLW